MAASDDFLLAFHAAHPGCTAAAFGHERTGAGGSSYDVLADVVAADRAWARSPGPILDLGCGDGYLLQMLVNRGIPAGRLIGLDMSPDELALARQRPALGRSSLIRARAQALPLADGSVATVLSHLAFMLMSDIDRVATDIARVLAPGGVFATVIGGGPVAGDAFEFFLDEFQPLYARQRAPIPRLSDRRLRSDQGIRELFRGVSGFARDVHFHDFHVDLSGSVDDVWTSLASLYELFAFSATDTETLRARFRARVAPLARADGTIPCTMATRLVRCQRATVG